MEELVTYAGFTPVRRGSVFILKDEVSFRLLTNRKPALLLAFCVFFFFSKRIITKRSLYDHFPALAKYVSSFSSRVF